MKHLPTLQLKIFMQLYNHAVVPNLSLFIFHYNVISTIQVEMAKGKTSAHCALVLLGLWACSQSVPISVDKTKERPQQEELEAPQTAVSHTGGGSVHS